MVSGCVSPESASPRATSKPGCRYGNWFRSTALTTLKIAVFAPTPRASVITAAALKPGILRKVRKAERISLRSVSIWLVDDARDGPSPCCHQAIETIGCREQPSEPPCPLLGITRGRPQ